MLEKAAAPKPALDAVGGAPTELAAVVHDLPVLASTALCLELLQHQSALDLSTATGLLSRDPGAVLRLYALVGAEYPDPSDRPERLEACIASVQLADLMRVLCVPASARDEQLCLVKFAREACVIAHYARAVAASLSLGQEQAYLVGLLHAVGTLPAVLGRPAGALAGDETTVAWVMLRAHHVPLEICHAVQAVHRQEVGSLWTALVHAAQEMAVADAHRGVRPLF